MATIPRLMTAQSYFETTPESVLPMELIDGEIITMPAPKDKHQKVSGLLSFNLYGVILKDQLGELRYSPCDVVFDHATVLQPDLFFVAKDNPHCYLGADNRWYGAPDLCVEILSSGNVSHDTETKFKLYQKFGVREYWIVNPEAETIQIWHLAEGEYGESVTYRGENPIVSQILPPLDFPAQHIF